MTIFQVSAMVDVWYTHASIVIALVTSNSSLSATQAYLFAPKVNAVSVSDPGGVATVSVAAAVIVYKSSAEVEPVPGSHA
jgi:hypothetical protein